MFSSLHLNVRPETIKLLEENIGRTLSDINHSKILYDLPPRVMEIKTKVNKWDLIKLNKLLHNKGNYKPGEKAALRMGEKSKKTTDKELSPQYTSSSCNSIPEK